MEFSKLMDSFRVSKIRRSGNEVAHLIAKFSFFLRVAKFSFDNRVDEILVNDIPSCVVNSVMNHCNTSFG